jgi:hypothetical protein
MGYRWTYVAAPCLYKGVADIAGWDTQLIARRAGSSAPLEVNTQVPDSHKEYLLLWRNSEKPKEPFNLTPYAITLVGCHLK